MAVTGIEDIGLWAPVKDGQVNQTATPDNNREVTKGTTKLGKDAFLNLLVAQMQYQDPLNPTSDTEWIAQMATFSTLEEMQNLNTTMGNSQAFSLVGKTVIVNSNDRLIGGKVDYVVMQAGKAYLAINESLYSVDDLDTIASEEYLKKLEEAGKVDKDEDKTDKDKTDTEATDKEEEKTDAEKIMESIAGIGNKLDTMGAAMTKAADAISDVADQLGGVSAAMYVEEPDSKEKTDKAEQNAVDKTETANKTEAADKTDAVDKTGTAESAAASSEKTEDTDTKETETESTEEAAAV